MGNDLPRARPEPTPTSVTEAFWAAAKEGRFLLQYDIVEKRYQFWPRPVSIYNGGTRLEWREASGRGVLVSRTNVNVAQRGFEKMLPFVLAAVDLEEGVRVVGRLVGVPFDQAIPGLKVKIDWEELSREARFYVFVRDAS